MWPARDVPTKTQKPNDDAVLNCVKRVELLRGAAARARAPALPPWRQVGAREVPDGGAGRVPMRARGRRSFPRGRSCASAGCSTRTRSRTTRRVGAGIGRRTRLGSTPSRCCSAPCAWRSSERRAGSPFLLVYPVCTASCAPSSFCIGESRVSCEEEAFNAREPNAQRGTRAEYSGVFVEIL